MKWFWNKCRRFEEAISLLATGALADEEQRGVQAHLAECPECRAKLAELNALSESCRQLGKAPLEVEPSLALRRRWMTAVRASPASHSEVVLARIESWLAGRRLAWGSLAAMWALVLFFRFTAPDAATPASVVATPPPLREALLVLKVERRESSHRTEAEHPVLNKPRQPDVLPPRSQRPGAPVTQESEAA